MMEAMAAIPHGETRTYGDLGTASAAIGSACGRNPVPVIVPCHRVVGADGNGGFSAEGGVEAKRRLLAFERGEGLGRFD
jgi:methylated-DNA-[protein]-cysteine S-methyltransferase